jgi:hypothetical protein
MRSTQIRRFLALGTATLLSVGGLASCSDEDGDGGTTDEEIEDVEDTADSVEEEIQEEVDAQDEGSNEDGE